MKEYLEKRIAHFDKVIEGITGDDIASDIIRYETRAKRTECIELLELCAHPLYTVPDLDAPTSQGDEAVAYKMEREVTRNSAVRDIAKPMESKEQILADIKKIIVENKYRTPLAVTDLAIYMPDMPLIADKILELFTQQASTLQAENVRLRMMLDAIVKYPSQGRWHEAFKVVQSLASEALKGRQ